MLILWEMPISHSMLQEAVELPLTHPEYYEEMGIRAPKGVILYGQPGTGKTLLAKAVANQTSATFLRVVGSELIQKYSGEGPKLVRELFRVAEENAPSIVFIDEIDAIGTKRYALSNSVLLTISLSLSLPPPNPFPHTHAQYRLESPACWAHSTGMTRHRVASARSSARCLSC